MYIADVGQYLWEEIDFQPATSPGGENWGWRCYEGDEEFNTDGCGSEDQYDFPVTTYHHNAQNGGCSVTGGYVYRGSDYPGMTGLYFFADYCFGRIWAMDPANNWQVKELEQFSNVLFTTFGVNINGELYIASQDRNIVYRIVEADELLFLPVIQNAD
jgi:hypothetical protein